MWIYVLSTILNIILILTWTFNRRPTCFWCLKMLFHVTLIFLSSNYLVIFKLQWRKLHFKLSINHYALLLTPIFTITVIVIVIIVAITITVLVKYPEVSAWFINAVKEFKCVVMVEELAFTIEEKGYPALVVSDNPSDLKETLTILTLKILSSDWVEQHVKALLPTEASFSKIQLLYLIINQALCSDVNISLLNAFSTVSKRFVSLWRGKDFEYWKKDGNKKVSNK